ncbi:MAG: hypothetical protein Metus_0727 [Candidatus Methanosuratincola subterraneus]|uniref:Uncharacterized protein n=1 Tax=Methanosuratincola subterraneus TaxID=2593994 RepID=A0A444L8P9_METS7|nr:MAG: hypothetical protein Metus_0727 [Candidatus Methanosuratincola subterraneus]
MRKFSLKARKGVSPIIATLLLIIIAVAAAVVTYSFVMGFIGGVGTGQSGTAQFSIDTYNYDPEDQSFTIYIRNIGTKQVSLSSLYIDGVLKSNGYSPSGNFAVGNVTTLTVDATDLGPGTHVIKLVFSDGTPLEFNVLKPSS